MGTTGLSSSRPVILAVVAGIIVVLTVIRILRGQMTGRRGVIGIIVAAAVVAFVVIREFIIK